jgi:hypothetical protein
MQWRPWPAASLLALLAMLRPWRDLRRAAPHVKRDPPPPVHPPTPGRGAAAGAGAAAARAPAAGPREGHPREGEGAADDQAAGGGVGGWAGSQRGGGKTGRWRGGGGGVEGKGWDEELQMIKQQVGGGEAWWACPKRPRLRQSVIPCCPSLAGNIAAHTPPAPRNQLGPAPAVPRRREGAQARGQGVREVPVQVRLGRAGGHEPGPQPALQQPAR